MPLDLSRYLDLYVAESREHLTAARALAAQLPQAGEAALAELYRHAHSLKGMAAAMGYARVAEVAHAAEDLLDAVRGGRQERGLAAPELLDALGCLAAMVERVARGEAPDDGATEGCARRLRERLAGPQPRTWRMDFVLEEGRGDARSVAALLSALVAVGVVTTAAAPSITEGTCRLMVLLRSHVSREALLDALAHLPGIRSFHVRPDAMETQAEPPARQAAQGVARVPAAALEALAQSAQDLLLEESRPRSAAARRRLVARLHAHATELRLEPFDSVAHRVVAAGRQAGEALGREVRIEIEGGELRLERSLLDALLEPLLHVVRNAVDHGIEPPEERRRAGKPRQGRVRLRLESAGADTRITVEDDGRGLAPGTLRDAAVRLGIMDRGAAERMTDGEALALITRPGFTTSLGAGPVSGRGVGMDVVRAALEGLGGTLHLAARPGEGTSISFRFPRGIAARPALLVRTADGLVALPLECVTRVEVDERGRSTLCLPGARLSVREVVGRREIVVQPLPAAVRAAGYSGAAVLEDGEITLVLDPAALAS
ncbi:MAG TPA: ATP-binding protein [Candidatus Polarisedimenticolaceae bacterium]|nr:ATP-binding protein [Candidatus Polarisedimenticolaceae bacterium]